MKNVQVIDGADSCTFSIFQATEAEFAKIFPEDGQDIQFAEDLSRSVEPLLERMWQRPIRKPDALGIHGTLFYEFGSKRHGFPMTKRERDWPDSAINAAQRKLYRGA